VGSGADAVAFGADAVARDDLAWLRVIGRVSMIVRLAAMSAPVGSSNEMPRADENVATSTAGVDDVLVTMD
jgi:hypothetical protein